VSPIVVGLALLASIFPVNSYVSSATSDPCAGLDLLGQSRCLMITAILNDDATEVTKLVSTPYVNINEDMSKQPGGRGLHSYLQAAFDSAWPPKFNAATALLQAGENPNGGINLLEPIIQAYSNDPMLLTATNFLLDNKFNPDFPGGGSKGTNPPEWMDLILNACSGRSSVLSQVLTSFAQHGANFSGYHEPAVGNGNMFHVLAYAVDATQVSTVNTAVKPVGVCPFDWAAITGAKSLLAENDQWGNKPIDIIGFYNGYPESSSCLYYTKWPYQKGLNTSIFTSWSNFFVSLGSSTARPTSDARTCAALPPFGFKPS
jgi:hypothetical protein